MKNKSLILHAFFFFIVVSIPVSCLSQEIEPRRWSHLPVDSNFAGGGYVFTKADIFFDPVLEIEDAELEMHTWTVKCLRTFALLHKSARLEFIQSYQEGDWKGLVSGVPSSISRNGFDDTRIRFAINLHGAPPLKEKDFADYRKATDSETIVGTGLVVHLPTGEYMDDKLINLGSNRYTVRPQIGVVHNRGKLSLECTGSVWFYTDNNDFYNGNKLEQDPLYTAQSHLIYSFRPGLWASASIGYSYGGESRVNGGEKNDLKEELGWAFSLGFPIARQLGVKFVYLGTRSQQPTGKDTDNIAAAFSYFW